MGGGEKLTSLYTRIIGVFFFLIIISLISDLVAKGFNPESMHKIFHVVLGIIILFYWKNKTFMANFPLINGAFFTYVAFFGFLFPDFAGLDTFNTVDTILHTIVGFSGLIVAWISKE